MQSEEIFLDMFEDEYRELVKRPINVEFVMSDASLLLPPTGTGILTVHFHLAGPGMVRYRTYVTEVAYTGFFWERELSSGIRRIYWGGS